MSDEKESAHMKKNIKNNLNNNDYLIKLNMSDAPRDVRMQWLCKMIENEMAKNVDEIDMDLVNECQEELDELMQEIRAERASAQDATASAKPEYAGNLASRGRVEFIKARNDEKAHMAQSHQVNRRFPKRLAVAAAAAVIILTSFAALSVVAVSQGYASAFEYVSAMAQALFNMNDGEVVEDGNITVIRNGNTERYSSIKDFVDECNLDIMYPTNLPEELTIQNVVMADLGNNKVNINFIFNNENLSLLINNYHLIDQSSLENNDYFVIKANYNSFYVIEKDMAYQAICHKGNNEYIIDTDNYDHLVTIINSLGGEDS